MLPCLRSHCPHSQGLRFSQVVSGSEGCVKASVMQVIMVHTCNNPESTCAKLFQLSFLQ